MVWALRLHTTIPKCKKADSSNTGEKRRPYFFFLKKQKSPGPAGDRVQNVCFVTVITQRNFFVLLRYFPAQDSLPIQVKIGEASDDDGDARLRPSTSRYTVCPYTHT